MELGTLLLGIAAGVGLSAAAGFRIFVPLFAMSLAAGVGDLPLASNMQWIGSPTATLALGTATALEIGAYYIPWLDNALDTLATFAAPIAGTLATASLVTDLDPSLQWSLALLAGGGTSLAVQAATLVTRAASTLSTGGLANPVVSTGELGAASLLSILALAVPFVTAAVVLVLLVWSSRRLLCWWRQRGVADRVSEGSAQRD